MKKLGKVTTITNNNNLLVNTSKSFRIGLRVINQEIKTIGKIVDVIGPIKSPYIVVNTRNAQAKAQKGDTLYILDKPPTQRSGGKPRSQPPKKYHKTSKKSSSWKKRK